MLTRDAVRPLIAGSALEESDQKLCSFVIASNFSRSAPNANARFALSSRVETHAPVVNREVHFQHQISQFVIHPAAKRPRRFAGKIIER